ncbi:MAG: FAD:protein FMN transferase [Negativicutes bacterium]|nr:FAD:protein FMN transferase [Negativicutes bacterium]
MKKRAWAVALLLGAVALSLVGCGRVTSYKETQFLMDTVIDITAYGKGAESAVKEAFREFKTVQELSDRFNPDSQVSRINRAAGQRSVKVDAALIELLLRAQGVAAKTGGKFDVTVGALTDLWGIGTKHEYIPGQQEIDKVLPLVDYRQLQLDVTGQTVFLPQSGMALDLGGIAKRFALDRAANRLKAKGIESALLNAGGDITVIGKKPDGSPWRIGVQHPRKPDALLAKLTLDRWDTVETSGDYQRYFMKDGIRYAHILDPDTGRQPREIISVTLVSQGGGADIRSSAIFVLGVEKGLELLKRYPGTEAIIITADERIIITPGLQGSVELER